MGPAASLAAGCGAGINDCKRPCWSFRGTPCWSFTACAPPWCCSGSTSGLTSNAHVAPFPSCLPDCWSTIPSSPCLDHLPACSTTAVQAYSSVDVPEPVIDLLTGVRNYLQARLGEAGPLSNWALHPGDMPRAFLRPRSVPALSLSLTMPHACPHNLQDKCEPPVYVSDRRFMKAVKMLQVGRQGASVAGPHACPLALPTRCRQTGRILPLNRPHSPQQTGPPSTPQSHPQP